MIIIYSVLLVTLIIFVGLLIFTYSKMFKNLKIHIDHVKELSIKNQKKLDGDKIRLKSLMDEIENKHPKNNNNFTKKNV